jgi:hypothetical protein
MAKNGSQSAVRPCSDLHLVVGIVLFMKACARDGAEFEVRKKIVFAVDDDVEALGRRVGVPRGSIGHDCHDGFAS